MTILWSVDYAIELSAKSRTANTLALVSPIILHGRSLQGTKHGVNPFLGARTSLGHHT